MKRKIVAISVTMLLLTSCGTRKLRSDIEKFITSFSLEEAVSHYLAGGYTSTKIQTGGSSPLKEEISFTFDVKDASHPQYEKVIKKYSGEELTSTVIEKIIEDGDSFIYSVTNLEDEVYTLEKCHDLIKKFFYKESMLDGKYNVQGMYYGDYLKQVAPGLQDYVTIDEEKGLYIMEFSVIEKINGYDSHIEQKYSVNRLGMLEKNHFEITKNEEKITQDISVFVK